MKNIQKYRYFVAFCLLFCLCLSGCRQNEVVHSDAPSSSPVASSEPWEALTLEELPNTLVIPARLDGALPPISLLGHIEEADISLYGISKDYGGGILLRQGENFTHFEQKFFPEDLSLAQLPLLWWEDFDKDGQAELAVKYHTSQDSSGGCTYDLIFYSPSENTWTAISAGKDFCAEAILDVLNCDWNERNHNCTLSYGGQEITIPFPANTAPGPLVVGHLCLFTEENGQFTAILDAWFPVLSNSGATFRAQVLYDGESVTLQNIRMDSFSGV